MKLRRVQNGVYDADWGARCIRVLVHCYSDRPREELRHVFLEGAASLRADLADPE